MKVPVSNIRQAFMYRAVRRRLSTSPLLYPIFSRLLGNSRLVTKTTGLVIDGFPRSANSFVEAAFEISQQELGIEIVSHSHAAAQIIKAVQLKIPTILLIRNPDDAVTSLVENSSYPVDARQLYKEYATFYGAILPFLEQVTIAQFDVVTRSFPEIVKRMNERFDTTFIIPTLNEQFLSLVAQRRDELSLSRTGRPVRYSRKLDASALCIRKARLSAIREKLKSLSDDPGRVESISVYNHVTSP